MTTAITHFKKLMSQFYLVNETTRLLSYCFLLAEVRAEEGIVGRCSEGKQPNSDKEKLKKKKKNE